MAATNSVRIMEDGPRNVILLIEGNNGATGNPGTGGTDLTPAVSLITPAQVGYVNLATLQRCAAFSVRKIEWDIQAEAFMRVDLAWAATTDQVFQSCIGRANKSYKDFGGLYAPSSLAGATGGIDISTTGAPVTQAAWTIVLYLVKNGLNPA
jgi:hypothetical protein